jgi:hypothetical protein
MHIISDAHTLIIIPHSLCAKFVPLQIHQLLFLLYKDLNIQTQETNTTIACHSSFHYLSSLCFSLFSTKMESIFMCVATRCIKNACGEGEWFGDISCIGEEDYSNRVGDSYREGDDDDDGGYDYAPAA